ncbi:PREDICTED: uncharacterized protein LOC107355006 [Acropora digitifera]|uniref:uncharacterized protein LOC107355006 n=1 Tax=Acropora digitifera TaxID=70779 RepID=UPI00077AF7C0|nr:PREDICTED: uncharacterized protein LOC107355006 [Acropora digitifera]
MIRQVFLLFLTWKEIFIASERCLKNNVTGHTAKRQFKVYDHDSSISLLPLKLSLSRRASQQISTHVLQILLVEVLGYQDVTLVSDESGLYMEEALKKLSKCENHRCFSSAAPDVMINTEVWVPSAFADQYTIGLNIIWLMKREQSHPMEGLGGIYLPCLWKGCGMRALELQSLIGELSLNASILNSQMNILEYQKSCESILGCSNGWLYGSKCKNVTQDCAVLLADFPGGIINEQSS